MTAHSSPPVWTAGLSDADLRNTMLASLRLLAGLCAISMALFWWKTGWRGAAMVAIGSTISGGSLWGFMGLMTAMNAQTDQGMDAKPMGRVLTGFFLRLGLTIAVLYGSLRYLNGSVYALAAGLGLGLISLTVQALRLMNRWTK